MAGQGSPNESFPPDDSVVRGYVDGPSGIFDERTIAHTPGPIIASTVMRPRYAVAYSTSSVVEDFCCIKYLCIYHPYYFRLGTAWYASRVF